MSRDAEIYQTVKQIKATAANCESLASHADAYPDVMALQQIHRLADGLLSKLDAAAGFEATMAPREGQQSSVEIEQMAKGAPKVKVKVYAENPWSALDTAREIFDTATEGYRPVPEHTNGVAT